MPEITDNLIPDDIEVGEIDYSAPESGSGYVPRLAAGVTYDFVFKLEDEPFEDVEIQGKPYFQINHQGTTQLDGDDVTIRFQRASFFKTEKMRNSMAGDLLRSLDLKIAPLNKANIKIALTQADGRATFRSTIQWRAYFKSSGVEVNTRPSKKKLKSGLQFAWPRDGAGKYVAQVTDPVSGEKAFGQEYMATYLLPVGAGE